MSVERVATLPWEASSQEMSGNSAPLSDLSQGILERSATVFSESVKRAFLINKDTSSASASSSGETVYHSFPGSPLLGASSGATTEPLTESPEMAVIRSILYVGDLSSEDGSQASYYTCKELSQEEVTFIDLPEEIHTLILQELEPEERARAQALCKQLYAAGEAHVIALSILMRRAALALEECYQEHLSSGGLLNVFTARLLPEEPAHHPLLQTLHRMLFDLGNQLVSHLIDDEQGTSGVELSRSIRAAEKLALFHPERARNLLEAIPQESQGEIALSLIQTLFEGGAVEEGKKELEALEALANNLTSQGENSGALLLIQVAKRIFPFDSKRAALYLGKAQEKSIPAAFRYFEVLKESALLHHAFGNDEETKSILATYQQAIEEKSASPNHIADLSEYILTVHTVDQDLSQELYQSLQKRFSQEEGDAFHPCMIDVAATLFGIEEASNYIRSMDGSYRSEDVESLVRRLPLEGVEACIDLAKSSDNPDDPLRAIVERASQNEELSLRAIKEMKNKSDGYLALLPSQSFERAIETLRLIEDEEARSQGSLLVAQKCFGGHLTELKPLLAEFPRDAYDVFTQLLAGLQSHYRFLKR